MNDKISVLARHLCSITVVTSLFASSIGDAVAAEQQSQAPSDASAGAIAKDDSRDVRRNALGLEEIIVTAQKRTERLQDVPISITALTPEEINQRGLVSASDYLRGMPSVNQAEEIFGKAAIVIRGIATSASSAAGDSATVSTYFGETPTTYSGRITGLDLKLVDIDRVEVLRGPQGTALGSSSLGGAVRTIPMAPKLDQFEGKVAAGYSVTSGSGGDNHMIQATGNFPLITDKLAIRATAYRFDDSGFYRNVAGSSPDFVAYSTLFGAQAFAQDADDIGATRFSGGRIAALLQVSDDLRFTVSYLLQNAEQDGYPHAGTDTLATSGFATLGTYDQALWQVAPEQVMRGERAGVRDSDTDIASATGEYNLGWGDVLATFSHVETDGVLAHPFPFGVPFSQRGIVSDRQNSGELRLTTKLDGPLNFLVGVYANEVKYDDFFDYYWFGSQPNPFGTPTTLLGSQVSGPKLKEEAAFGEVSWKLLSTLTLTGGVRAYDYEKSNLAVRTGPLLGNSTTATEGDASGTSFRGNLTYKPNDDATMYAAWSEGFRMGNPQAGLPQGVCDVDNDGIVDGTTDVTLDSTRFVESDTVDNYELGIKLAMLDHRMTVTGAVYRIEWNGVPFAVRAPDLAHGGCGLPYQANAGSARSEGFEVEADFQVTDALRVELGGSKTRAVLTEDAPSLGGVDGDRLPGSPEYTANLGLQYAFNIGSFDAFVRSDAVYVGSFFSGITPIPSSEAGDYVKWDVSAHATLGKVDVSLYVRNLTDADDFVLRDAAGTAQADAYGYRLRPRTVGLQLDYNF